MRRTFGILLIIAGPVVVAVGYLKAPSTSACAMANGIATDLGQPATCSTSPSLAYLAVGAVLLIAGLLVIIPWARWLTGSE